MGASFARFRSGDVVEIARVLRIEESNNGIPHVRFTVTLRDRRGEYDEGQRTLGLEAFKQLFNLGARNLRPGLLKRAPERASLAPEGREA